MTAKQCTCRVFAPVMDIAAMGHMIGCPCYAPGADLTHGERVKASILATGLALWRSDPASVTARAIGRKHGMTHSAVLYHFKSAAGLRDAIARHAVAIGDAVVVPQLITAKHPAADTLGVGDRRRYLDGC